jgi:hypothetical protein
MYKQADEEGDGKKNLHIHEIKAKRYNKFSRIISAG